jgi:hypothetical protein
MNVIRIEKFAKDQPGEHAKQVESYSLGRFMDDLHSEQEGEASEADRGAQDE